MKNKEDIAKINDDLSDAFQNLGIGKAVILDTDFGGDIDDMSALAMLLWGERMGLTNIIGVSCSLQRGGTSTVLDVPFNTISALDAFCTYFGIDNMAFGIDKSAIYQNDSNYCGACMAYEHTLTSNNDAYDSPEFYRRALAGLPEGKKCDVAIIGYLIPFSRFLSSQADEISPLTGIELAQEKINKVFIIGGSYPNGMVETNFAQGGDPRMVNATNNVLTNCPNDIIFVGADMGYVHCGDILYDEDIDMTLPYKCLHEFITAEYENHPDLYTSFEDCWHKKSAGVDCFAVMLMQENLATIGLKLTQGTNTINTDTESEDYGKNTFTAGAGHHYYAKPMNGRTKEYFIHRFDSIICERNWSSKISNLFRLERPE